MRKIHKPVTSTSVWHAVASMIDEDVYTNHVIEGVVAEAGGAIATVEYVGKFWDKFSGPVGYIILFNQA
jgi:hypothetical protein